MTNRMMAIMLVGSAAGLSAPASENAPSPPPEQGEFELPLDASTAAEIDGLIPRLGAPDYQAREKASARLMEIGAPALSKLRDAFRAADSLEIRLRIEEIVEEAYLSYHVYDRNGFLGIGQGLILTHAEDARITGKHVGVTVSSVIADTAAQRAGLREFDIIVAVDGDPIAAEGGHQETAQAFGESIRRRRPGTAVELTVLRDGSTVQITVLLGPRSREYYGRFDPVTQEPDAPTRMLLRAHRQFRSWWREHFRVVE